MHVILFNNACLFSQLKVFSASNTKHLLFHLNQPHLAKDESQPRNLVLDQQPIGCEISLSFGYITFNLFHAAGLFLLPAILMST